MSEESTVRDRDLLRRIFGETRGYRYHIAAIFLISLIAIPLALLGPVPLKIAVDSVLGSEPVPGFLEPVIPEWFASTGVRLLLFAAGLQIAVVFFTQLQSAGQTLLQTYTGEKLTLRFRSQLLAHAQRLSFSFHDARGTADSIYRIQWDAPAIQYVAVMGIIPFVTSAVTLAAMIYIVVRIDVQLALVALAVSPFLFLSARTYRIRMRPQYRRTKRLESSALGVIQEVLTSLRVVKAFGREESEEARFEDVSRKGLRARLKLALAESLFGMIVSLTTAVGTAAVLFIGIQNVQSDKLTLGELLLVLAYLSQLYGPLRIISRKIASLQNQLASGQRAFDFLDETAEIFDKPDATRLRRARGDIELRAVSFSYDGVTPVLADVSFEIPAGTRLGLKGRTGVGKSTLASLLTRFYDVTGGAILLDGLDIREYKLVDLRNQFAIVLQDPLLFSTSIAENIAYARPDANADEIVAAAAAADAHDFISRLPDGYDTVVGERGMRLSGGEGQRISLARAFLKDAPILILDEPTSSVDVETEQAIMTTMRKLMEGRTALMIAHRLSTLDDCDVIVTMKREDSKKVTIETAVRSDNTESQVAAGGLGNVG